MATPIIRFNFRQLADLDTDLKKSVKSLPVIIHRVLTLQLRELRRELRGQVPRGATGALRRSLGLVVKRDRPTAGSVLATFGFMRGKRISGRTAIAANVLQKPGAVARKRAYVWVPLPANQNITPQQFFNAENTFIQTTRSGNKIAFVRSGDAIVPLFVLKHDIRLSAPPLPIEQKVEAQLPEITTDIQETIKQVIEAKRVVSSLG